MSYLRSPSRRASSALRASRFPRFATLAAAGYLALATVDLASEPAAPLPSVRPVTPSEATQAAPAVRRVEEPPRAAPAAPAASPARTGVASWYGSRFHGRRTASGEPFDMHAYTAAHRTLPFGTPVEVRNPENGRTVVVRINDRGPHSRRRAIDLSYGAARDLGIAARGTARVELRVLR